MAAFVLLSTALAALPVANAGAIRIPAALKRATFDTCSSSVQSCSSGSGSANSCCVNTPGGQFLQPQFWDTDPVTGPDNSWTVHGLWPDNCDGTYSQSCDSSRAYSDITSILNDNGKSSLVDFMQQYWQSNDESPEKFWEHEWATHGTCVSTLEPDCYSQYQTGQEVADYFQVAVDLFKTLDTYGALSDAGITPSSSKTYSSSEILNALEKVTGEAAVISCSGDEIYQIYYGFFVNGPLQNGDFVPSKIVGQSSNCPSSGIKYLPKNGGGVSDPGSPSGGEFSGKGFLNAIYKGNEKGCLISAGTWYTTGTCAGYTASSSGSGFTLSTSKGDCGISNGKFTCGSGVKSTEFTADGSTLVYQGSSTFYATEVPSGQTQATVYTSTKNVEVTFEWESS
ncbi:ribonuclease-like protein T2 [Xylaria nigripes]|nr:ribonuclease-like protein T2 [Xylaria nigripes]